METSKEWLENYLARWLPRCRGRITVLLVNGPKPGTVAVNLYASEGFMRDKSEGLPLLVCDLEPDGGVPAGAHVFLREARAIVRRYRAKQRRVA
jgi:hypothetical protein